SNRIPMSVLGWKTPIQKRRELETAALMNKLFLFFSFTSLTNEQISMLRTGRERFLRQRCINWQKRKPPAP
ncbi:MAG: hypothetical protein LUG25_04660, partial [Oscillospiraceae bacterium]|nr:hypothetical protein [Oscillospiraceae bacterium]